MSSEIPTRPPAATTTAAPAPRPATPGLGGVLTTVTTSRSYERATKLWGWRRAILFSLGTSYAIVRYSQAKAAARKRDAVHDKTYLYWKLYDGGIVEAKSTGSNLNYLLNSSQGGSPEEPPRVMTLFDVIRTLKFIEQDDRIHGIIADFSHISVPTVPSYTLGLAQLEEIQDALLELRRVKQERLGKEGWRTVAWTDSFQSQGQYLFASAFDEIYTQPTGEVPLVGMGSTTPFFGRLAKWLGIEVHAEARNEYKSFVQPYIDEKLTPPQKENQIELLTDLNSNLLTYIARNRFPTLPGQSGLSHVQSLSQLGPYTATEAAKAGLINGVGYRQDVLDSVLEPEKGGDEERKVQGLYHYARVMEKAVEKSVAEAIDIGVVYLLGTIGDPGEFGTAAVVRGLKEAGEDASIGAVVLRIDSGGGGVVESDTIWAAVRDLREKYGKTVVASFGNASASGGYLVSTHTDAIIAAPSTVTGSIGVASLRPTFLTAFFDRFHITLDSFFTGSRSQDVTHRLSGDELVRHKAHVDEMYEDFKNRVCEGRGIDREVIELIAGGRVMTGLKAFELNAPEELIRQIKGLNVPLVVEEGEEEKGNGVAKIEKVKEEAKAEVVQNSPVEKGEEPAVGRAAGAGAGESKPSTQEAAQDHDLNRAAIVVLPEDQDTSPYAPPSPPTTSSASSLLPTATPPTSSEAPLADPPALAAATALATSTPAEQEPPSSPSAGPVPAAGRYEVQPGPFGRGLIDGIGGIRDAMVYACELFISNGIAGYKVENPNASDTDAVQALLPGTKWQMDEHGELTMQMDVRLKRFPLQKSFWQQVQEASARGDSMEVSMLSSYLKATMARWFLQMAAGAVSTELEELGLDTRRAMGGGGIGSGGLGLGNASRRGWMRAEWSGVNLK